MKMSQNLISPHLLHFTEIMGLIMMTLTEVIGKYQISYVVFWLTLYCYSPSFPAKKCKWTAQYKNGC